MSDAVGGIVTLATLAVGVAIVAVLVSKNAQTSSVLSAGGQAFGSIISAAVSPVTGTTSGNAGVNTELSSLENVLTASQTGMGG